MVTRRTDRPAKTFRVFTRGRKLRRRLARRLPDARVTLSTSHNVMGSSAYVRIEHAGVVEVIRISDHRTGARRRRRLRTGGGVERLHLPADFDDALLRVWLSRYIRDYTARGGRAPSRKYIQLPRSRREDWKS